MPLHPNLQRAFDLLGIAPCAFTGNDAADQLVRWKDEVLKPAWRDAARRYHPDTAGDGGADTTKFQEAQAAYCMLLGIQIKPPAPPPKPEEVTFDDAGFGVGDPFGFPSTAARPDNMFRRRKVKAKPAPRQATMPRWTKPTPVPPTPPPPTTTALAAQPSSGVGFGMRRNADGSVEVQLQMRLDDPVAAQQVLATLAEMLKGAGAPEPPPPPVSPEVGRRAAQGLRQFVVIGGGGNRRG